MEIERGDLGVTVLEAAGELRHWSERRIASRAAGRDDIRGMYDVGYGAYIDLSDVRPLEVELWPADPNHLVVRLDENTTLEVLEQEEAPE